MNQSRANNVGTVFSFLALTVRIPLLVCWVFFFCGSARHELAGGLIETHHSIGSVMIASQSSTSQRSIGPHSGGGMRPLGKKKILGKWQHGNDVPMAICRCACLAF